MKRYDIIEEKIVKFYIISCEMIPYNTTQCDEIQQDIV